MSRGRIKGSKLSKEHIEKLINANTGNTYRLGIPRPDMYGSKNPNWRGGTSKPNEKIRRSIQYKLWKRSVLERDKKKCIWCSSEADLNVDHIKPFALYPELRFAIDNGRTLCAPCHRTTDTYALYLGKRK